MNLHIFISPDATIKEALKKLDKAAEKILFVVDDDYHLLGTLTDGDIRRHIIKTANLEGNIKDIYNKNPIFIEKNEVSERKIKNILASRKIGVIPITDENKKVVDYISWSQIFSEKEEKRIIAKSKKLDVPVVIMAGGKGTRMAPFTQVLPKPLIPVGNKTIIEHIIDSFRAFGADTFYITINYKGEMIEAYFNGIKRDYNIKFIWEEKFLGTAGSLKLLKEIAEENFFVSNCDILIKADFGDILQFHRNNAAMFTSITSIQHYKIPYGVVKTKEKGLIESIIEKPEYTFQINTGVYVLNKECLEFIPDDAYFDMPELINILLSKNKRVLAYPVNESDYIDTGQWEEYKKALSKLEIYHD